jgi:hypothetical protein
MPTIIFLLPKQYTPVFLLVQGFSLFLTAILCD